MVDRRMLSLLARDPRVVAIIRLPHSRVTPPRGGCMHAQGIPMNGTALSLLRPRAHPHAPPSAHTSPCTSLRAHIPMHLPPRIHPHAPPSARTSPCTDLLNIQRKGQRCVPDDGVGGALVRVGRAGRSGQNPVHTQADEDHQHHQRHAYGGEGVFANHHADHLRGHI